MAANRHKTLLEPGHEDSGQSSTREKAEYHRRSVRALTPSERIARAKSCHSRASRFWPPPYEQAMSRDEPSGPDLDGVVADANAVGLPYVVIGGFSVMANGFLRGY
jgi:hypothetical protein